MPIAPSDHDTPLMSSRFETAARILGKRWTVLIIASISDGPKRFCQVRDSIDGLSDPVLSSRLVELEKAGLVDRGIDLNSRPAKIAYSLTEKAERLIPTLHALKDWATDWMPANFNELDGVK